MTVLVIRRLRERAGSRISVSRAGRRAATRGDRRRFDGADRRSRRVNIACSLRVKWCGSRELPFTIQPGEIVRMECRPNVRPLLALLYITLWRNDYIALETVKSWTQ